MTHDYWIYDFEIGYVSNNLRINTCIIATLIYIFNESGLDIIHVMKYSKPVSIGIILFSDVSLLFVVLFSQKRATYETKVKRLK